MIFVSVVVPALNCAHDVAPFAEAIRRQDYPAEFFEVIVVDNGSTDDTFDRCVAQGFVALRHAERGRARALNRGLGAAKGAIVLTTDLSCRPEPGWIRAIVDTFAVNPDAGCVAGEISLLKTDDTAVLGFQERSRYMSPFHALDRKQLPFMPFADGANASFRKRVLDELGGFEASFVKGADVEICYRLLILTPYRIVFNRFAVVWEPGEPSLGALMYQRFRMGIGWNLLQMKFPALYASRGRIGARRWYWGLRAGVSRMLALARLNLRALRPEHRDAAVDANIRLLMTVCQRYGEHYGRWWLRRRGVRPAPIDDEILRRFVASPDRLQGRISVVTDNRATATEPSA